MNKGGIGIGSASIVLVFAVLCLTVFTLISLSAATSDRALTDAEAGMVAEYYKADTLAERILADIISAEDLPDSIRGIDIISFWDENTLAEIACFACPVSDNRELYVVVAIFEDTYDIRQWNMRDICDFDTGDKLNVWQG